MVVPIFMNARSFIHYQPSAIHADLLQTLRNCAPPLPLSINSSLLALECYLQITRQTLCKGELNTLQGQAKLKGFVGALFSPRFQIGRRNTKNAHATVLRTLFRKAGATKVSTEMAAMTDRWKNSGELPPSMHAFAIADLDPERVKFWRGWPTKNRVGQWPDGSWCHPANRFIWKLFEKGLSRRNRGGTLSIAAAHISQLLRFCWNRRIDPFELNDNHFREFIGELIRQKRHGHPEQQARTANAVIAIGRSSIEFLDSLGQYHNDDAFIGPKGRIQASKREHILTIAGRRGNSSKKTILYWDHPALPEPSTKKKRLPIASANIEKLRKAIAEISRTPHQRIRRYVMLKLLEVTPSRRGEVALITAESVLHANRMETPMLLVPTLKKKGGRIEHRYVPISRADAKFLAQYAEIHRRIVVRRFLKGKDHGLLLLNGRNGESLRPNTITQEIARLAKAAGIQEKACPHMFRHRFITKLFVALIEQYQVENPDHFRRMLIDGEEFKRKVAEWTGHSDLSSLDVYINFAFDEISNFKKVYNLTTVNLAIDSFIGTLHAEVAQVEAGEIPLLSAQRLLEIANNLKLDLEAAKTAALVDSTRIGARSAVSA